MQSMPPNMKLNANENNVNKIKIVPKKIVPKIQNKALPVQRNNSPFGSAQNVNVKSTQNSAVNSPFGVK